MLLVFLFGCFIQRSNGIAIILMAGHLEPTGGLPSFKDQHYRADKMYSEQPGDSN